MAFPARYEGLCIPCGEDIKRDDMIILHRVHGYIHEECADIDPSESTRDEQVIVPRERPTMPPGKTVRDRCDRCFLVHTAAQGDECQ